MNKSSFLNNKALDKSNIALICIFGMGIGFLFSVFILSVFTFLFGVNGIRDAHPRHWLRNKWWLVGVGWLLLYAVTYFWSADKAYWGVRLQTKLPFLILPLAISYLPAFTPKQLQQLTVSLALIFIFSACYSLYFLVRYPAYYISGYRASHLLPTLPHKDYIRSSLAMALFVLWSVYVWPFLQGITVKWFIGVTAVFVAVFMHILASKSGLVSLYLFLAGWSIYLAFAKRKVAGIIVLIAIPVCLMLAIRFIPTLRERTNYILYSYAMMKNGDRSGNYGDINRLMSYKIAISLIKDNPLTGVGTGTMFEKMTENYRQMYPKVPGEDVLLPHNQFLIVAMGCGIPALLLFTLWVFMPLADLRKNRQSFFFFMTWLILLFQLMIEPVLEVQNGVFVYLFFLVLLKHELPDNEANGSMAQLIVY